MAEEILSQGEIDALLSAISKGEMDTEQFKVEETKRRVKVYDFKRALRFSKDQIRSLSRIHDNLARLLTTYFSAQLRTYIDIKVASVDQLPYEEFIRSIPKVTILNVFEMEPLEGRMIMEVNPVIAYAMMERMLGGQGRSYKSSGALTEIETRIISQLFERMSEHFKEAWSSIVDIEPSLDEFESNPQFLQMVSPNETVIVISLNTTIGDSTGMINICIPHVVLEPIISKLSVHYWMQTGRREQPKETADLLQKKLEKATLPLSAELGTSTISVEDFLSLQLDDVIELQQSIHSPLVIKVGDVPKFTAQPGTKGKKLAVQILEKIKGGEEEDE
ncbi:flagellar motor switch protein FliM [Aureibacillus halotolerans]|uniref:Flagellar motor switch protein FliM n=1 Tax=Aureibacillus halotolerans TaxID=1508390 RepID=A0A4R6U206_9BACI|nr:flagellar motor switch protein FliM [Aureibacillus halotolerans]TDQ39656.1 flagellar motor switch protein FliM [Aureibacillus halotolerans]